MTKPDSAFSMATQTQAITHRWWYQGRSLFLQHRYFEAHEAWEALWITLPKVAIRTDVVQALIQCCAVGVHVQQGNLRGIQLKYGKLRHRLHRLGDVDWSGPCNIFPLFQGKRWEQTFLSEAVPSCLEEAQELLEAWHLCF